MECDSSVVTLLEKSTKCSCIHKQETKEEEAFTEAGEETELEMYFNDFRNRNIRRRF